MREENRPTYDPLQVPRIALPADVLLQVDRNVPAVVLPNTHLPLLGPTNVWSFMPVP